jgi:hypothetical protein
LGRRLVQSRRKPKPIPTFRSEQPGAGREERPWDGRDAAPSDTVRERHDDV